MQTAIFTLVLLPVGLLTVTIQFLAIVNLFSWEKEENLGGNRWLWVILILLTNLIGSILYLVVSLRKREQTQERK